MNLKNGLKKSMIKDNDSINDDDYNVEKDISFSDEYEDNDFKRYFEKREVLALFQSMEDDNLFKINNI